MSLFSASVKPPNVLVYVGEKQENIFKNIASNLRRVLHFDQYVIYELKKAQVLGTPWKENVALLVVYSEEIDTPVAEAFQEYLEKQGKIILFCSNFDFEKAGLKCKTVSDDDLVLINYKMLLNVPIYRGKYSYSLVDGKMLAVDSNSEPVIMKSTYNNGNLIVSAVNLVVSPSILFPNEAEKSIKNVDKCLDILKSLLSDELNLEVVSFIMPRPTAGYVIADDDSKLPDLKKNINLSEINLGKSFETSDELDPKDIIVPLMFQTVTSAMTFDKGAYFSILKSDRFGRVVIYFPIITSTMIAAEQLSKHDNIAIIASRQISGVGRSNNKWISPEGCAMFTLNFSLSLSSRLGQRISILQHMASLAVVHGIRKNPAYNKLEIRLKWPNDIYYEKDKKIGGVLVNTTIQGSDAHVYVGIGVNVSNERPTICINKAIETHNSITGDALPLLKMEEVIALTLTELETLIDKFEKLGPNDFFSLYYSYWVHKDQRVSLSSSNEEVTVKGLDEYGFLIVETSENKQLVLQPDGNRFDMMKNLIISK